MQFWGAEVKQGESFKVAPEENKLIHISQASLGEVKKEKGNEQLHLYVKIDDRKLGLGTLVSEKIPQISFDLAFEKEFELSHTGKNGSVFFTGYSLNNPGITDEDEDDEFDSDEAILPNLAAGKSDSQQLAKSEPATSKQKVKIVDPKEDGKPKQKDETSDEDEDGSSEGDEDSSDEDKVTMIGEVESSDEDDESMQSEDDETPAKGKKRPLESAKKTPVSEKRAKLVTPQKTDGKKVGGHTATPHPAKQAAKLPKKEAKQQTPKSGGDHHCNSCNRRFKTEEGLQSHNKAKHSAGK